MLLSQHTPAEGGSMRFHVFLSVSPFVSSRNPNWAPRPQTLWPLQVQDPWSRLILLGIVSPVFPVQHHSPSAGMVRFSGFLAWRGRKAGVA